MDRYGNRGKIMADLNEFQSKIGRVETGRTEPKVSTFYRIASALGLTVELTPAM